ncbi:MAG: hypothetical protein ACFNOP_02095, partial [Bacteroides sp.]
PVAADLVARDCALVEQEDVRARGGLVVGGGDSSGARADDDDVGAGRELVGRRRGESGWVVG